MWGQAGQFRRLSDGPESGGFDGGGLTELFKHQQSLIIDNF